MITRGKNQLDERLQARERLRKLPAEQRDRWLDIAEAEFRSCGFEAASLNGILSRAGLSKGQAYYYFADKGELYRAVIARAFDELAGLVTFDDAGARTANGFWLELGAFFERLTVVLGQNDRLAELGRGIYREARAQEAIADLLDTLRARFVQVMERGRGLGAVRSDLPLDLLTDMAFGMVREADRWFALNTGELDGDRALALNRQVFALFVQLLAPDGGQNLTPVSEIS